MTVLTTGDVRGFYEALGVELPGWSRREAPVRCFAAPETHNRGDRSPSTSVNLSSGAWYCHGCGACGGAYDAALSLGHSPRNAIELMISYGLIEPRGWNGTAQAARHVAPQGSATHARSQRQAPAQLGVNEAEISRWESSLSRRPSLLAQLALERGWRYGAMRYLQLGLDSSGRVTIPIRNGGGELRGVQPLHSHGPKMLAVRGTRLGPIPHPTREPSNHLLLVEGPADMIAARSYGLPAIAVPGAHAWRPEWAELLAGRQVTVVMDCDGSGRAAAMRIEHDLTRRCNVAVVDLDPGRADGFDLSDVLLDYAHTSVEPPVLARLRRQSARAQSERGLER
jgi:Toprim-like